MLTDNRNPFDVMRSCLPVVLLLVLAITARAQDTHSWDALEQLKTGDHIRLLLVKRPTLGGEFVKWAPEMITVGSTSAKREEVVQVERYRPGGWSRGKRATVGALIGFGGGLTIGAAAWPSCGHTQIGPCISRGEAGAVIGGAGAVIGGVIGALMQHHRRELIYTSR